MTLTTVKPENGEGFGPKRTRLASRLLNLRDVQRARNMNDPAARTERARLGPESAKRILDPRLGDMENDRSATKQRSLLSIAGSLLAEISLTKLLFVWAIVDLPARGSPRFRAARSDRVDREGLELVSLRPRGSARCW